jgi:arylsulfatase A-like enzyme
MNIVVRALGIGAAFGLAASTVDLWLILVPVVERRFGPGPRFMLETAALEIALCALLGIVAAPLLRLRRGTLLHVATLALAWAGLAKWVELDSALFARVQFVPPVIGALLLGLGLWLGRSRTWVPVAAGLAALAGGVVAPDAYLRITTPAVAATASLPSPAEGAPDIVLIVLDTVRAQNLSTYGYARPTSPTIDALAREGALFLDATSPSTWSLASHASLFTGRYPSGHGAHMENRFLDGRFPTLADVLASRGYETRCFTANPWISDGLGLTRGFAWQDPSWKSGGAGRLFAFIHRLLARFGVEAEDKGGGVVTSNFADWVRERPGDGRPTFVFLNFIEAHFPYHQLPDEYLTRFTTRSRADLREISLELVAAQFGGRLRNPASVVAPALDMYDGGIVYSDHLLGRVVDALRKRGTLDHTILVVLSDHGEVFGEHGDFFGHGPSLYEPMIRVPLLVRYPPTVPGGVRVERPVSTVGVYATILDLAGIPPPPTLHVGSLVPVIAGGAGGGPVLSERHKATGMLPRRPEIGPSDPLMQIDQRFRAYRSGNWKLIETSGSETFLFDVVADPSEKRNLAGKQPAEVARLAASLARVRAEIGLPAIDATLEAGASPDLDPDTTERLRELGYIQ